MFTNSGINKVFLVGTIGKDPQLHNFQNEYEVLCFPFITNEVIKKMVKILNSPNGTMLKYQKQLRPVIVCSYKKATCFTWKAKYKRVVFVMRSR